MSFFKRLLVALPRLLMATVLACSVAVGSTVAFFSTFDLIMGSHFFSNRAPWVLAAGIVSWVIMAGAVVYFKWDNKRSKADSEGMDALASIMISQLKEEKAEREALAR